jgi:hypothetical protein
VQTFYRETLGSSLDLGVDVLRTLGFRGHQALRAARTFKQHDEASIRELAEFWEDDDKYFSEARKRIEAFDKMFASDAATGRSAAGDRGWDPMPSGDTSLG